MNSDESALSDRISVMTGNIVRGLYAYGHGEISLSAIQKIITNNTHERVCISVERHSPNYWCGYLWAFDTVVDGYLSRNEPFFHIHNETDKQAVFKILFDKSFTHPEYHNEIMIGPNAAGCSPGYRLLYIRKYGYENVYRRLHHGEYKRDMDQIAQWELRGFRPSIN